MPLIEQCLCEGRVFRVVEAFGLDMRECVSCGVFHQHVLMSPEEYVDYYRNDYHETVYTHSYNHDLEVGMLRVRAYGDRLKSPVLDVGCGNGAFVNACEEFAIDAVGQDIASGPPLEVLEGSYATITAHDVLEHAVDPGFMLQTMRRLLLHGGHLILDFPSFFEPEGFHHWKPVEHLWMLRPFELNRLLEENGFTVSNWHKPVPGKRTIYAR